MMSRLEPKENKVDQFKLIIEQWHKAKSGRIIWKMKAIKHYQDMTHYENLLLAEMAKIYTVPECKLVLCVGMREPSLSAFTARMAELILRTE